MKTLLVTALVPLLAGLLRIEMQAEGRANCECTHHAGGCTISKAAPAGFKCRCKYKGAWTCSGTAYPCVGNEYCPGDMANYCACKLGKGNCGGYIVNPNRVCGNHEEPRKGVPGTGDCTCSYSPGGCIIHTAAPFGWKCVCVYKGFWTCSGWGQQCAPKEVCLADDYSYCGCDKGGGNCGGYPDKPFCNPGMQLRTCDCKKSSDFSKGLYSVDSVSYDIDKAKTNSNLRPLFITEKELPNRSNKAQSVTFTYSKTITQSSSYSYSHGLSIGVGVTFKAGIPFLSETEGQITVTDTTTRTWGKDTSTSTKYEGQFTCNGEPHANTKCSAYMEMIKMDVPFVMLLKHNIIPNCVCPSYGIWTGTQAFRARYSAESTPLP